MPTILADLRVVSHLLRDVPRLLIFSRLSFDANNFLERDDIGIDLAQNPHDAVRANTSIQAATLVDVVSGDTYAPCLPRAYRLKIYRFDEHLAI